MISPARLAVGALQGRKLYTPDSGRKPVLTDPWHVIAKRTAFARKRLRPILYGTEHGGKTPHVPVHRLDTWGWLVREFTWKRDFRYIGLLTEARRFVELHGWVDSGGEYDESLDLDLIKAFQKYLYERRRELETWRNRATPQELDDATAKAHAKSMALLGVCPICGDDLPCVACGVPVVGLDGRGGLKAV